ncbi:hypothetical protein ACFVXW_25135 [Streptomyces sp. NPDC058251]|uniref:hypothetical protein n=1 Tax=unclassified Streptomyces TaxID=2593676 RepID=UPI00366211D9
MTTHAAAVAVAKAPASEDTTDDSGTESQDQTSADHDYSQDQTSADHDYSQDQSSGGGSSQGESSAGDGSGSGQDQSSADHDYSQDQSTQPAPPDHDYSKDQSKDSSRFVDGPRMEPWDGVSNPPPDDPLGWRTDLDKDLSHEDGKDLNGGRDVAPDVFEGELYAP